MNCENNIYYSVRANPLTEKNGKKYLKSSIKQLLEENVNFNLTRMNSERLRNTDAFKDKRAKSPDNKNNTISLNLQSLLNSEKIVLSRKHRVRSNTISSLLKKMMVRKKILLIYRTIH